MQKQEEPEEGQRQVGWVIKNRARANRSYWGGNSIKRVCLQPGQFECWNGVNDIPIHESEVYQRIYRLAVEIMNASYNEDPTDGSDHYNNQSREGYPGWTNNCDQTARIGNHQFYRGRQ